MGDISILIVLLLKILFAGLLEEGNISFFSFLFCFRCCFSKLTARGRFSVTELQSNLKEVPENKWHGIVSFISSVYLHFTNCLKDQLSSSETVLIIKNLEMFKSIVTLLCCKYKLY